MEKVYLREDWASAALYLHLRGQAEDTLLSTGFFSCKNV